MELWGHQQEILKRTEKAHEYALFWEMGTGKSRGLLEILRAKCNSESRLLRTLIVAPLVVVENWRREILKYTKIQEQDICVLVDQQKRRIQKFKTFIARYPSTAPLGGVVITNYEALRMNELYQEFTYWKPEFIALDESHKIKNVTALRTKKAIILGQLARYKFILSGTPILNNYQDIFSQFWFLDGGSTFGTNFYAFRHKYFVDKNAWMKANASRYFPKWEARDGVARELKEKIYVKAMRVTKEECLDLPPLLREKVYVEMTPEQTRAYTEMKKNFITFVRDQACTAQIALTKALRLMQICSGFIKTEEGGIVTFDSAPRREALKDLLEELTPEHKVIVWAVFRENYEHIRQVCNLVGVKFVEVHGEVDQREREAAIKSFNEDPETRVYIGHPASGGIGVNLTVSSYSIFYSRNFSLEQDLQAESRNHRGGSEIHQKITRIDLLAKGTIDELVLEALANKIEISENVLRSMVEKI